VDAKNVIFQFDFVSNDSFGVGREEGVAERFNDRSTG
jgi:hypothetical protein